MLKYLEEKVINHCFWDILLFLFLSFFWLTFVIVRIDCQKIHCPVFYQTAGLKETLLLWASFSSQVWQAGGVVLCRICCVAIWYLGLQMFCFFFGVCFSRGLWCIFLISVVRQSASASLPRLMSGLRLFYSPWKASIWCSQFYYVFEKSKSKQKTNKQAKSPKQQWQTTKKRSSASPAERRPGTKRTPFSKQNSYIKQTFRSDCFSDRESPVGSSVRRIKDRKRNYVWQFTC